MNLRPKTIRRLLILFAALALVSGIVVTWLALSQRRIRVQIAGVRKEAVEAYKAGDYSKAVGLFSEYLNRSQSQDSDAQAVLDYARCRANTPMEGGRHVPEAIRLLENYLKLDQSLALDPNDVNDARHLLLKLYNQTVFNKDEAKRLAEKLLAQNPSDADALSGLAQSLEIAKNYPEALATYHRLNQLSPNNLASQLRELDLMSRTQQQPQQIVRHARELLGQHPDGPSFVALMSVADLLAHDDAAARKDIEAAAKLPPSDPDTVLQIVPLLDAQQEFQLSEDLLTRSIAKFPQASGLLRQLVERMWQRQRPSEVINRLAKIDRNVADSSLLGYKAMALYETSRAADAKPLVGALAGRNDDAAKAWVLALRTTYIDRPSPPAAIRKYNEAILRDPTNSALYFMLGHTYSGIGEVDQALRQWNEAGRLSPSWALPYCLISRALSAVGRYPEALRAAQIAHQRAPGTQLVETSYAWAWYGVDQLASARPPDANEINALFGLLENIQKAWPNEPITLPFYVTMLARRGQHDRAVQVARDAIVAEPAPGAEALLQLASASEQEKLGLEQPILDRAEKVYGTTPSIAFARAMTLCRAGKPDEAVESFDSASHSHSGEIAWRIARAKLHDALGRQDALTQWISLADALPDNIAVQYGVLLSPTRVQDRAFWRRTIARVKSITGPAGQLWQLEEARWQLAGQPSDQQLASVISSLRKIGVNSPSLPDAHRLLAEALLRKAGSDQVANAIAELTAALDLRPGDFDTTARLAQLLASRGMRDRLTQLVDAVARQPRLPMDRRLWAAELYGNLGRADVAIKLLTESQADGGDEVACDTLLAQLYRRSGRLSDAASLYQKLLSEPGVSADALAAGAEFFAASNQPDVSGRFVDRIRQLPLKPGALAILCAHLDQIAGQPQEAIDKLIAAAKEAPKVEQVWQELSGAFLRMGKMDDADRAAADGLAAIPGSPVLAAMRLQIGRLRSLSPQEVGPLLEVICHDPRQPVVDQAIKLMADAKTRNDASERVLSSLRQLADQHTDFVPLQELLAGRYAKASRLKEATDVASRASAAAPDDPEPLRLLCAVQTAAGDWEAARQAALRWRRLLGGNPLDADVAIARTYLRQAKPDPAAAIAQLAPYLADGASASSRQAAMPMYCSGLIGAGRTADAAALLEPSLTDSRQSRLVWMELSAAAHKDADAATAWLQKVAPAIPPDSIQETLALADAWEQIGTRFDEQAAHEAARDILGPIVARPNPPAQAWPAWAGVNESLGNPPQAERAWREYLKINPSEPLAQNNLAYMLLLEGSPTKLAEAEQLSRSAIAEEPGVSTLYDTLARIQLRQGKTDDAVKNFRASLDRDPTNVEAMIGLAEALQPRSQDREEVKSLLTRIDAALRGGTPLPNPLRKQLDRVKSAVSSSL